MTSQTDPNDLAKLIEEFVKKNGLSSSAKESFSDIFRALLTQDTLDETVAQRLGQFFYYYSQIDEILTKIIKSLLPELDLSIMGIDSSFDGNSFRKKVELIKSLAPNSNELKIFPLLLKLNSTRNALAHESPEKVNFGKINENLSNVFKEAFYLEDEFLIKVTKSVSSNREIDIPVKIIMVTKIFLELFANIETMGKKEDARLRLFESIRKFSSLYVRRRFSILAYQIQTRKQSSEAPDHFKQEKAFEEIVKELKSSILGLLKSQ